MSSNVTLKVRLGPLVSLTVSGSNCDELNEALKGYVGLNHTIDEMCSDLSNRVYPEGDDDGMAQQQNLKEDS